MLVVLRIAFLPSMYIRTTKTSSGSIAVQVVRYRHRKKMIVAHIGSARNRQELAALKQTAAAWIEKTAQQPALFSAPPAPRLIPLEKCQYLGFRYALVYESLLKLFTLFKFHLLSRPLLTDLIAARIIEPASKLQSLQFLDEFLGIRHSRRDLYRQMPEFAGLQAQVEARVLAVAKKEFHFDFSLVFYDVTTLYFESFKPDELRKPGYSKDNKAQQPQIVIGLLVTADGFPVAYHLFEGNKFEGHTLIPVIAAFKRKHRIGRVTVVADAAMISMENVLALRARGLHYIVGARMGNISPGLLQEINAALKGQDGAAIRMTTAHGDLVCDFSQKRYRKDMREMERQIQKAEGLVSNPGAVKRAKFLRTGAKTRYELNTNLVEKTKLLLGIKGYYTNLGPETDDQTIIDRYHSLWHVEQAFRIAKSDLRMRPIYHFKRTTIEAHILICFMALAVCRYMELKIGKSTRHIVKALKSVTDARILNTLTREEITLRSEIKDEAKQLLIKLGLRY